MNFFTSPLTPLLPNRYVKKNSANTGDYAVLVHGLARTGKSFCKLEKFLENKNYQVITVDYPSRKYNIEYLVDNYLKRLIHKKCIDKTKKINFVTHSMGGILVRYFLKFNKLDNLGKVVMISPPNKGSEIVDFLQNSPIVNFILGPAFKQLGTGRNSVPNILGNTNYEVGVITGSRSFNLINSIIIPGADDGKVSVESAKITTMKDFMVVKRTHSFIMNGNDVISNIDNFLKVGRFIHNCWASLIVLKKIVVDKKRNNVIILLV